MVNEHTSVFFVPLQKGILLPKLKDGTNIQRSAGTGI